MKKAFLLIIGLLLMVSASAFAMSAEEKAYIKNIEIYDIDVRVNANKTLNSMDVYLYFKMRNNGNREVAKITMKAYYVDKQGEDVRTETVWALGGAAHNFNLPPFVPGAIWQLADKGSVNKVFFGNLTDFANGKVELEIIDLEFYKLPDYINKYEIAGSNIILSDLKVKRSEAFGTPADLNFKLQNNANKVVNVALLRLSFYDAAGSLIQVRYLYKKLPGGIAPGAIWQFPRGENWRVDALPIQWQPGKVKVEVVKALFNEYVD